MMHWRVPAKLNWTLRVLGRRPDGYHEIRSWFVAVDWCDELKVELGGGACAEGRLTLAGPWSGQVPDDHDNLVLRAEEAWRAAGGRAPPLRWTLAKQVPAGAGLGGGSADAAAALRALERVAEHPLGDAACSRLAAALGSDVPFFWNGRGAELRGGRGELLLQVAEPPRRWLVLAGPPFAVATAAVYAALRAAPCPAAASAAQPATSLPEEPGPNDLEEAAYRACPELRSFAAALAAVARFSMSGSGGAHFASFEREEEARAVARRTEPLAAWTRVVCPLATAAATALATTP